MPLSVRRQQGLLLLILFIGSVFGRVEAGSLSERMAAIEEEEDLRLGVYLKRMDSGETVSHRGGRPWYLASTIKIPLAVAILQKVDDGALSLTQELTLKESDYVDGSGDLQNAAPGSQYTVDDLNFRSVAHSDSTATDMLIRLLGEEALNRQITERMVAEGFGPITTILQVRYEAYGEIHPRASELSNLDFIDLKNAGALPNRFTGFLEKLKLDADDVRANSVAEAFERYYQTDLNAGSLSAMGLLLERIAKGELLSDQNNERLLNYMRAVNTGDHRIKAGLPENVDFAHKTGTQIGRSCNVGIINPQPASEAIVIAVCAEGYTSLMNAERAFSKVGKAVSEHWL
ncbi:serine hydrolase [Marinimicrobium sp. ARAG 43.8]|uniref:serine hydrolase n=1 Tax=Marinimicrobium sp. ARAG 43.8 TaxID=3418719 RepID=UPI003CF634CF